MDTQIDRLIDTFFDRLVDGWIERQTDRQTTIQVFDSWFL